MYYFNNNTSIRFNWVNFVSSSEGAVNVYMISQGRGGEPSTEFSVTPKLLLVKNLICPH